MEQRSQTAHGAEGSCLRKVKSYHLHLVKEYKKRQLDLKERTNLLRTAFIASTEHGGD